MDNDISLFRKKTLPPGVVEKIVPPGVSEYRDGI